MTVSLLDRRRVEAETLTAVYKELTRTKGEEFALDAVARTVSAMAHKAGREFALQAPNHPSLRHFAGIVNVWNGSGNLEIVDVEHEKNTLSFKVTRCAYADLYRTMGVPGPLAPVLSCARDAPFARGYSNRLRFFREDTIADGAACCDFLFRWEEE